MTQIITPQEIPEVHLSVLKNAITQAVKKTKDTYVFIKVPLDEEFSIVAWVGLNDKQQMEECYFLTNDIVRAPIKIHPSIGSRS